MKAKLEMKMKKVQAKLDFLKEMQKIFDDLATKELQVFRASQLTFLK